MDIKLAQKILEKVQKDYDLIAKEWNESRAFPRPFQVALAKNIKKGEKVLDAGCGNGVLYDVLASKSIDYTGLDVSARLLQIAKKRASKLKRNQKLNSLKIKFVKGSILKIPFKDEIFDWVLALGVLHHLPSPYQKRAVEEIYRVLKPDGQVVVSAWNLYSEYVGKKILKKEGGLIVPWKATPGKIVHRYFHWFEKKELADLFKKAGFQKIRVGLANYSSGNWTKNLKRGANLVLIARK